MPFDQQDFGLPSGRSIEGRAIPATGPTASDTILNALIAARAIISDPTKWCRCTKETNDGRLCSWGALMKVTGEWEGPAEQYLNDASTAMSGRPFWQNEYIYFNDKEPHERVIAMWDRAIALAEADAAGIARSSTERPEGTPPLSSLSK